VRAGEFIKNVAASHRGARLVAACWLALPLLASQVPQYGAPLPTTDGLGRSDMYAIASLGLDRLADSTLIWLLMAATIVVWLARRLFPLALVSHPGRGEHPPEKIAERLSRALLAVAGWARTRRLVDHAGVKVEMGALRWGRRLATLAATGLVLSLIWTLAQPAAELLEVPLRAAGTQTTVAAWRAEAGRLVALPGSRSASCSLSAGRLRCSLNVDGKPQSVDLAAGSPLVIGSRQVVWLASASDVDQSAARLLWRPDSGEARWFAFDVIIDRMLSVASLQTKVTMLATSRAGPIVFGTRRLESGSEAFVQAAPELLIGGLPSVRMQTPGRVRLLIAPALPSGLMALLVALALAAALLLFALPGIELDVSAVDGRIAIRACNRPALLVAVQAVAGADSAPNPEVSS